MNFKRAVILAGFVVFALYTILILSLFSFYDLSAFHSLLFSKRTLHSIRLSIYAASAATLLSLLLAVPAGYALSRYEFPGKGLIDTVLEIPLILSPIALGAALLIFFNTRTGRFIESNIESFVFEVSGIILVQFICTCGIATRVLKTAFDEIPERYEAVARTLGASPFRAFFTVTLPLSKGGILSALLLSFAKGIGEFGGTITLCGAMPMKTETLPIAIYLQLSTGDVKGAVLLITILMTIAFTLLALMKFIKRYA